MSDRPSEETPRRKTTRPSSESKTTDQDSPTPRASNRPSIQRKASQLLGIDKFLLEGGTADPYEDTPQNRVAWLKRTPFALHLGEDDLDQLANRVAQVYYFGQGDEIPCSPFYFINRGHVGALDEHNVVHRTGAFILGSPSFDSSDYAVRRRSSQIAFDLLFDPTAEPPQPIPERWSTIHLEAPPASHHLNNRASHSVVLQKSASMASLATAKAVQPRGWKRVRAWLYQTSKRDPYAWPSKSKLSKFLVGLSRGSALVFPRRPLIRWMTLGATSKRRCEAVRAVANLHRSVVKLPFMRMMHNNSTLHLLNRIGRFQAVQAGEDLFTPGQIGPDMIHVVVSGCVQLQFDQKATQAIYRRAPGTSSAASAQQVGSNMMRRSESMSMRDSDCGSPPSAMRAKNKKQAMDTADSTAIVGSTRVSYGDYFGMAETLFGLKRQSRARALQPTVLLVLTKENALLLMEREPRMCEPWIVHAKRKVLSTFKAAGVSLFSCCSENVLKQIADQAEVYDISQRKVICQQNECINHFRVLISGQVHALSDSADGERVSCLLEAGHYFGETHLVLNCTDESGATYTAGLRGCCLLVLAGHIFRSVFAGSAHFQAEMRLKVQQKACSLHDVLTHGEARQLLVEWLRSINSERLLAFRDSVAKYQQVETLHLRAATRSVSDTLIEDFFDPGGSFSLKGLHVFHQSDVQLIKKHQLAGSPVPSFVFQPVLKRVMHLLEKEQFPKFLETEPFNALLASVGATDALMVRNKRENMLKALIHMQTAAIKMQNMLQVDVGAIGRTKDQAASPDRLRNSRGRSDSRTSHDCESFSAAEHSRSSFTARAAKVLRSPIESTISRSSRVRKTFGVRSAGRDEHPAARATATDMDLESSADFT